MADVVLVCQTHGVTLRIGSQGERRFRTGTLGLPACALLLAADPAPGNLPVPGPDGRPSAKKCTVVKG